MNLFWKQYFKPDGFELVWYFTRRLFVSIYPFPETPSLKNGHSYRSPGTIRTDFDWLEQIKNKLFDVPAMGRKSVQAMVPRQLVYLTKIAEFQLTRNRPFLDQIKTRQSSWTSKLRHLGYSEVIIDLQTLNSLWD